MAVAKELKVDKEFGKRFFSAWMRSKYKEYNQNELSKLFDVSPQTVSSWINSRRYPYIDTGIRISKEFVVTMDWLYVGREPRIPKDSTPFDHLTFRLMAMQKEYIDVIVTIMNMLEKRQITPQQVNECILNVLKS